MARGPQELKPLIRSRFSARLKPCPPRLVREPRSQAVFATKRLPECALPSRFGILPVVHNLIRPSLFRITVVLSAITVLVAAHWHVSTAQTPQKPAAPIAAPPFSVAQPPSTP